MTIKTQTTPLKSLKDIVEGKNIVGDKKKLSKKYVHDLTRFLLIQGRKSEELSK